MLICTDLMSRGIDFKTVNQVVNFDFPQSLVSYIHRIGRTGRGGKEGCALTFFTDEDKPYVRTIANLIKKSGDKVEDWMLNLKACDSKDWKKLEKKPLRRKLITTAPKPTMPKRFLKKMEKNMRKREKIKGMFNPPVAVPEGYDDGEGGDDAQFDDDGF